MNDPSIPPWIIRRSEAGAEQEPRPGLGLRLRRGEGSGQRGTVFGGEQERWGGAAAARLERVLGQRSKGEGEPSEIMKASQREKKEKEISKRRRRSVLFSHAWVRLTHVIRPFGNCHHSVRELSSGYVFGNCRFGRGFVFRWAVVHGRLRLGSSVQHNWSISK